MSKEFQLAWPCPHLTTEEHVPLSSDRRTLSTRQPLAGAGTVRILVNNDFLIPQGGLYSSAQLSSSLSGPFFMTSLTDTLVLDSPEGAQTFRFGGSVSGLRFSTDQLVNILLKQGIQGVSVENNNGHLTFTELLTVGIDSYLSISGTAANALGFGSVGCEANANNQRRASGRQLYPSWNFELRPDDITNRYPRFDSALRNNPVFKVTYTVPPERCLRCGGTRVENDYRYDEYGQYLMIENENLLYQAALKMLLTDKGSNPFHSWYGTTIKSRIGAKAVSGVASLISEDVRKALQSFKAMQDQQAAYQKVSPKERMFSVTAIDVRPHVQDQTTFLIYVSVRNASNQPVNIEIVYTVPSVVSFMGSNGLMLGGQVAGLGNDKINVPGRARVNGVLV
jgi:hypothetical protein